MGVLSKIFSADKVLETADGIFQQADEMNFSNEERAKNKLELLKAYEPFKLAQRLIAMIIVPCYCFGWLLSIGFTITSLLLIESQKYKDAALAIKETTNEMLGWSFLAIISLYFAGGVVNSFSKIKKKEKV